MSTQTMEQKARDAIVGAEVSAIDIGVKAARARMDVIRNEGNFVIGNAMEAATRNLINSLRSSGTAPGTLRTDLVKQQALERAAHDEMELLGRAVRTLLSERTDTYTGGADAALAWLHDHLTALTASVKDLAPDLVGISTSDDAVRAGGKALTAWSQLAQLVDQYGEIRTAQRVFTREARGTAANLHRDIFQAGTTKRPADPGWQIAAGAPHTTSLMTGSVRLDTEAWPGTITDTDEMMNAVVPSTSPAAYLLWLAERGDAWVPTSSQLSAALNARSEALQRKPQAVGPDGRLRVRRSA